MVRLYADEQYPYPVMNQNYKLYLDVCCLNRPFDDWTQQRVRLEGEVVLSTFERIVTKEWELISSEAIEAELFKMSNLEKLQNVQRLLNLATTSIIVDSNIDRRSQELESLGFGLYDSFHIACAEIGRVDVLLTTDDRLLNRATRYVNSLNVVISNPVTWLMSVFQSEGESNDDTL
jgi:predicted nucleic acid-binding protein